MSTLSDPMFRRNDVNEEVKPASLFNDASTSHSDGQLVLSVDPHVMNWSPY